MYSDCLPVCELLTTLYIEHCLRQPLKGPPKRGLLIQGHLTGNSSPWSWLQWPSLTGGRLIRLYCMHGCWLYFRHAMYSSVGHRRTGHRRTGHRRTGHRRTGHRRTTSLEFHQAQHTNVHTVTQLPIDCNT